MGGLCQNLTTLLPHLLCCAPLLIAVHRPAVDLTTLLPHLFVAQHLELLCTALLWISPPCCLTCFAAHRLAALLWISPPCCLTGLLWISPSCYLTTLLDHLLCCITCFAASPLCCLTAHRPAASAPYFLTTLLSQAHSTMLLAYISNICKGFNKQLLVTYPC